MPKSPDTHVALDSLRKLREADAVLERREARLRIALAEVSRRRSAIEQKLAQAAAIFEDIEDLISDVEGLDGEPTRQDVDPAPVKPIAPKPASSKPAKRAPRGRWTTTIKKLIDKAGRPVVYSELREMLMDTPLAEKLRETEKSFYGAIGRLAHSGKIVREDGYLFAPSVYRKYKADLAAGTVEPLQKEHRPGHASPAADHIKSYLRTRPLHGATSAEIIEHLLTTDVGESVERNRTFAYNVLSRLRQRGELIKSGSYYRLPDQNDEAPDDAGASTVGSVAERSIAPDSKSGGPANLTSEPGPEGSNPSTSAQLSEEVIRRVLF